MKASPKDMEALHGLLCKILTNELQNAEEVTPALLNVARQFLRDNNIEGTAQDSDYFEALVEALPDKYKATYS